MYDGLTIKSIAKRNGGAQEGVTFAGSKSNTLSNAGYKRGIRVGSRHVQLQCGGRRCGGCRGNIYGAEIAPRALKKYAKK